MTNVVWKHLLDTSLGNELTLQLPYKAKVLHFGYQTSELGYALYLWEAHNETFSSSLYDRTFLVMGTGISFDGDLADTLSFIKSVQVPDTLNPGDEFVFHLFEVR